MTRTAAADLSSPWTPDRIEALGPTTTVGKTAEIMDVGEWTIYEAIRRGKWTHTRVLRIGRIIKIPTRDIIALLYPSTSEQAGAA